MSEFGVALSGYDKASGEQFVAGIFLYLVRFSGKQRFIDLHASFHDDCICADLVARLQDDLIILYKLFGFNLLLHAVPHDDRVRCIQQIHLVQCPLRANLLYNSNQCIADDNRQESQVPKRTDQTE